MLCLQRSFRVYSETGDCGFFGSGNFLYVESIAYENSSNGGSSRSRSSSSSGLSLRSSGVCEEIVWETFFCGRKPFVCGQARENGCAKINVGTSALKP